MWPFKKKTEEEIVQEKRKKYEESLSAMVSILIHDIKEQNDYSNTKEILSYLGEDHSKTFVDPEAKLIFDLQVGRIVRAIESLPNTGPLVEYKKKLKEWMGKV
jgi:hypothetical protein